MKKLISVDYNTSPFRPQTIQMDLFLRLVGGRHFSNIDFH